MKVKRPVFIVCCPNSGSSILQTALVAHPDLCGTPLMELPDAYGQRQHIEHQELDVPEEFKQHLGLTKTSRRWAIPGHGDAYYVNEDDWTASIDRQVKAVLGQHVQPGKRLILKNPSDALRVRLLQRIFPDALFIWIVRNGYATVKSIRERALYDSARPRLAGIKISPEEAAQQWFYANVAIMLSWSHLNHGLVVRYEDLVGQTRETLYRVLDFLELEKTGFPIPRFKRTLNQQRIRQMNSEEIELVSQIGWPMLREFNYEILTPYKDGKGLR